MKVIKMDTCNLFDRDISMIDCVDHNGNNYRLIIEDGKPIRLILSDSMLQLTDQTKDFRPFIEVEGYYNG